MSDIENIHLACWTKDETCDSILINRKDGEKYSQLLIYNDVVKNITYDNKDLGRGCKHLSEDKSTNKLSDKHIFR